MPRLLTLGWLLLPAAALAADPPVYPAGPPAGLSQSLPSLVSGSLATGTVPAPVMVSQPAWGHPPAWNTPAWTAPVRAPLPQLAPRLHRLPVQVPLATGCDARYSLLDRLRAWLSGGAGAPVSPGWVFAPPVVPVRDWGWRDGSATGTEGVVGTHAPMGGRVFAGPRPIRLPLPSARDCTAGYGRPRPALLRRIVDFFTGDWLGCDSGPEYASVPVYGGSLDAPPGSPLFAGYPTAIRATPLSRPLVVSPPVYGQPVAAARTPAMPVQSPVASGFHFAAPEGKPAAGAAVTLGGNPVPVSIPAPAPISVSPPATYPSTLVPASATQPFTRQR